jgi:serine/threonine protein kinase
MPIAQSSRLGDYEILSVIGEGGMGVVYRAHDHRLRRDVAIKVLAGPILAGADRAHQALQEARHAARLNHPQICTVHEVGESDGESFIVMELIDGRSLQAVLAKGTALPVESIVAYGGQIADALAHAHDRGVIHRDLKAANVMVTDDGRVKVLDFGIAELTTGMSEKEQTTVVDASSGSAAGTLAYMAPERLLGEPASERSDLWALGVLLFKMASGSLPFTGRTAAETTAAILQAPLPPLPLHVPGSLRGVIQRCLTRTPGERYQKAREVRAALEVVGEARSHDTVTQAAIAGERGPTKVKRIWRLATLGAAMFAVVVFAIWIVSRTRTTPQTLLVSSQQPVAAFGGAYRQATLSPDGSFIAFVAADKQKPISQIWIKNLAQGDPIQITSPDVAASSPTWSPKNDQIVYVRQGQGLWSVSPLGGTPRQVVSFGARPRFSADGDRLVFERGGKEIWIVGADGSNARRVEGVPESWYSSVGLSPALSPDGASVVYFLPELGPNGDLWIVPSAGGIPRRLTNDATEGSSPIWTPDGRFIIYSSLRGGSRTLWRVPLAGGAPETLTVGAGDDLEPVLSRDARTLIYTNVRNQWRLTLLNPDTGARRTIVERRTETIWPRFSPDGSKVAFFARGDVGDVHIFIASLDDGLVRQLTQGRGQLNSMPRWSADGSTVFFYQHRPTISFRSLPLNGGDSREIRPWRWESHTAAEFDGTGTLLAYFRQTAPGGPKVTPATVIEDLKSGRERELDLPLLPLRWSADGQYLLGGAVGGARVVWICASGAGPCRRLTDGFFPVWSGDGSSIYFLRDTDNARLKELWSIATDGRNARKVFDAMGPFRGIDVNFDVSRTGAIVWNEYLEGRHELWQATLR